LRIALIAPPWLPVPPPAYGGTETVVDQLARGLQARGHEVLLCATGDSTSSALAVWEYDVAETPRIGAMAVEITHVMHAYEHVADADVIHDHTLTGPVRAAAHGGLPVVTTNHGPFDRELAAVYRDVARRVPVIAISHCQARAGREAGVAVDRVIHHGIDAAAVPVGRGDGGYLAFLGRMIESKGADLAARAARAAGIPLKIAAKMREPAEREYFDTVVAPLLGGDVEYVGELSATDKLDFLGGAVALLNPLRWAEPFGLVMIEAMACGTPVVAPPRGSVPEIVEDGTTGLLYRSGAELARALGRLDTLDRGACRRAVETRFSADRMVGEHLELYEQVANQPARRGPARAVPDVADRTVTAETRGASRPPAGPPGAPGQPAARRPA
jgi:glycosyltransferase involved in cell wall biosynthesis